MSLAPTLLTLLVVSPAAASPALAGRTPTLISNQPQPARAVLTATAALAPTLLQTAGPTATPGRASVALGTLTVSLQKIRIIEPGLSDLLPNNNDLTVTIRYGEWPSPVTGLASLTGRVPRMVVDDSYIDEIGAPAAQPVVSGLLPTIAVSTLEESLKSPRLGLLGISGLAPSWFGERAAEAGTGTASIAGLRPGLKLKTAWQTVAFSGITVWTEVERQQ